VVFIYDKDLVKIELKTEEILRIIQKLGATEPFVKDGNLVIETICHNAPGEGSNKLYYYPNTGLFKCYTHCGESFDIYELIIKNNKASNVSEAMKWIDRNIKGFSINHNGSDEWQIIKSYKDFYSVERGFQEQEINIYDKKVLSVLPFYIIKDWLDEGISVQAMQQFEIKFNPVNNSVIIPHFNRYGDLIGIRQRTLVKEDEIYGKYKPATIDGKMYNHPLSFAAFGLNQNKDNILKSGVAIIFEGEKSVLLYESYFGRKKNISVACCGSSISDHQIDELIKSGAEEVCIAFDKEFHVLGDSDYELQVKHLKHIYNKYKDKVLISFIFDKENKLGYKDAPIDRGRDTFIYLFNQRFTLKEE
jgi:hypothetical protein